MNWQPIYAVLLFGSTLVTYLSSILMWKCRDQPTKKKILLAVSLVLNFSVLFAFKYFNFINESIFQVLDQLNVRWTVPNLDILLPVGISFYTFQAVGYTIDVYRGTLRPEKNLGIYALFVSFFPQLVAGPIERATNLLPVSEFWQRWHISLSTWFRDYLYIPIGGNRVSFYRHLMNLVITFIVSGIWHGANWTFILWGGLHGAFLIVDVLRSKFYHSPSHSFMNHIITVLFVVFAWIFFRANNVSEAGMIINKIFTNPGKLFIDQTTLLYSFFGILILFIKDFKDEYSLKLSLSESQSFFVRNSYYVSMICIILLFGVFDGGQFIYFQF